MKRLSTLMLALALSTVGASAQQQPALSVSRALTWINEHFERVDYSTRDDHIIEFNSLAFQGCSATLSERSSSSGIANYALTEIYGPFDLSDLIPDKIQTHATTPPGSSSATFSLEIDSVHPVPRRDREFGKQPSSLTEQAIWIDFATEDIANRQAKAWHDAIVACGGKAVPDNLY